MRIEPEGKTKYDWDSDSEVLPCPKCVEDGYNNTYANPLRGGKTYECFCCGHRFRPKKGVPARVVPEGNPDEQAG